MFVCDVALPELPIQSVVRVDRVEHDVDRVLGDRMAEHPVICFWGGIMAGMVIARDRGAQILEPSRQTS